MYKIVLAVLAVCAIGAQAAHPKQLCRTYKDCPLGHICLNRGQDWEGQCLSFGDLEEDKKDLKTESCRTDNDCLPGMSCEFTPDNSKECRVRPSKKNVKTKSCQRDHDCKLGMSCEFTPDNSKECRAKAAHPRRHCTTYMDCHLGHICLNRGDGSEGQCLNIHDLEKVKKDLKTESCRTDNDCLPGMSCEFTPDNSKECRVRPSKRDLKTESCRTDNDCLPGMSCEFTPDNSKECRVRPNKRDLKTESCRTDNDCLPGMSCEFTPDNSKECRIKAT